MSRFLKLFFFTNTFSLVTILVNACFQTKNKKFDAEVTFKDAEIDIKHLNKDLSEPRNWDWISKYQEDEKAFYLLVNQKFAYKEMLFVKKSELSESEISGFRIFLSN
jgi:hypothetical protein